jgi:hypothetical protein
MNTLDTARVVQVIRTDLSRRGTGKSADNDPIRVVTQYWDFEGNLLAEDDPVPSLRFEALVEAGDRLVHNLTYARNEAEIKAWWEARGGHDFCTVCRGKRPSWTHTRECDENNNLGLAAGVPPTCNCGGVRT